MTDIQCRSDDMHINLNEFSERHARATAADLCVAFSSFQLYKTSAGLIPSYAAYKEFIDIFTKRFAFYFENEFAKQNSVSICELQREMESTKKCDDSGTDSDLDCPSFNRTPKPFYRKFSLKGLRKGKSFFQKTGAEPCVCDATGNKKSENDFATGRIKVECRRVGDVHQLVDVEGHPRWEKCRLSLSTHRAGGYILLFYSPPKSKTPKSGVFCHLLNEVREATALEMPDKEHTAFVIRAAYNAEFVIDAQSPEDRRDWVATLKYCMRESHALIDDSSDRMSVSLMDQNQRCQSKTSLTTPDLPPRPGTAYSYATDHNSSNGNLSNVEMDLNEQLKRFPWFHGPLKRVEATQLVQHSGEAGQGIFLVRQSETREGEYVLTFNHHGKAKHLRLTVDEDGSCIVQQLVFPSIFGALEHFRADCVPLDNGTFGDCKLGEFVLSPITVALDSPNLMTTQSTYNEAATYDGPLHLTRDDLSLQTADPTVPSTSTGFRAVSNAYSFI